ncbi:MAG: aminotransferase class I/II-fold pyridoxal phosphate-dependent enzyme [Planctomycetes bacterium]|nr:aminotransferase class I/II-fold pyridoxal phosphate-dependent enzyme [Planctomycetota bacterium]
MIFHETQTKAMTSRFTNESPAGIVIAAANESDRKQIASMRHVIYAHELGQHPTNGRGVLRDHLDEFNTYIVARLGSHVVGFVSITPPPADGGNGSYSYSIEKYIDRGRLPFAFDDALYEARLLTVTKKFRRSQTAILLMYAALRWIEHRGGDRIVLMGRREVIGLYRKTGFTPLGIIVHSGEVEYEIMTATIGDIRSRIKPQLAAMRPVMKRATWQLDVPFDEPECCYHGGAFFKAIGERFESLDRRKNVINADVLDAWFDPSPRVLSALTEHLPWLVRTSPPTDARGLQETIAETRGVPVSNVLPGAGSSDLIYLALRHWLKASSRALILDPTYGEYAHVLERVIGCGVDRLELRRTDGYAVKPRHLAAQLRRDYNLVVLVNPNSPTGQHIRRDVLERLIAEAPNRTRFWIDETYLEYVGADQSLERFAAASSNTIVCKSMSKVYALSGVRAAYLCGPAQLIDELRPLAPPWAVSLPAQLAAVEALQDREYYAKRYQQTHRLRAELAAALTSDCDLDVVQGTANFLLCHLPESGPTAANVAAACRKRELFIRDAGNLGQCLGAYVIRIAVKDAATNQRVVSILSDVLRQLRGEPCEQGDSARTVARESA